MRRPVLIAVFALAACGEAPPPALKFEAYGPGYASKPDLAQVEYKFPLSTSDLAQLTPDNLKSFDQEQIDQIYARLTAGPIPNGPFAGGLFFPKGISGDKRIAEIIGGLPGLAAGVKTEKLEIIGKHLWRGKVFYRDQRVLRNRIEDTALLKPLIDGDLSTIEKMYWGKQYLLFPARLYVAEPARLRRGCDHRLFLYRRHSGYREPGFLAGRAACKCATRFAWYGPASTSGAPISARFSSSISRSTTRRSPNGTATPS
jgi:hypothetical protein